MRNLFTVLCYLMMLALATVSFAGGTSYSAAGVDGSYNHKYGFVQGGSSATASVSGMFPKTSASAKIVGLGGGHVKNGSGIAGGVIGTTSVATKNYPYKGKLTVSGGVLQGHDVFVQNKNSFAGAGNLTGADYDGTKRYGTSMSGYAATGGISVVNVSGNKHHQRSSALTAGGSIAGINGCDRRDTNVYGQGMQVNGTYASNKVASAGAMGSSDFSYKGKYIGGGIAGGRTQSDVSKLSNGFKASASSINWSISGAI